MSKRDFLIKLSDFDDFQLQVINKRIDNSLIVRGCAGSGKSLIAFWHFHDIITNSKGSAQIIVFTRSLMDYFMEGCREWNLDPDLVDYWWHWQSSPKMSDYILVDEAQDFSLDALYLIRQHATKAMLLYGDSSQQLYAFKKGRDAPLSMEEIQRVTNFPTEQLVFNYRLPKKIARVAQHTNVEHDVLETRCKHEGTDKPYFLHYPSRDDQYRAIIDIIRMWNLDDVGILLPRNDQAKGAVTTLRELGLDVEYKYRENGHITSTLNFATSNPKVMTYHSSKGLQFRAVFLPECDNPKLEGFLEPLYVAMTRSYQSLYILYSDQLPEVFRTIPSELYDRDYRAKEIETL